MVKVSICIPESSGIIFGGSELFFFKQAQLNHLYVFKESQHISYFTWGFSLLFPRNIIKTFPTCTLCGVWCVFRLLRWMRHNFLITVRMPQHDGLFWSVVIGIDDLWRFEDGERDGQGWRSNDKIHTFPLIVPNLDAVNHLIVRMGGFFSQNQHGFYRVGTHPLPSTIFNWLQFNLHISNCVEHPFFFVFSWSESHFRLEKLRGQSHLLLNSSCGFSDFREVFVFYDGTNNWVQKKATCGGFRCSAQLQPVWWSMVNHFPVKIHGSLGAYKLWDRPPNMVKNRAVQIKKDSQHERTTTCKGVRELEVYCHHQHLLHIFCSKTI